MMSISREDLEHIITVEHWGLGKSVRLIERELGLSNDTLRKLCKKYGIDRRDRKASINSSQQYTPKPTGVNHWSQKNPERHEACNKASSERMRVNNPSFDTNIRHRQVESLQKVLAGTLTFHETLVFNLFNEMGLEFEAQKIVRLPYISDFVIGSTTIEIDGRGHASRAAIDAVRDKLICDLGFNVVRVQQDGLFNKRGPKVFNPGKFLRVLKHYIPHLDVSAFPPPGHREYRVLVREAYTGTTIKY